MNQLSPAAKRRSGILWLAVTLILGFFLLRLIAIDTFPPFLDEALHIQQAELSFHSSPLTYTAEGRLFSLWWYMAFRPHLAATVWLMRAATLLAILPGFAAIIALGRLMAGWWGAVLAALLHLFSVYHVFFERLALADPMAASAVLVGLYLAYRLSRRVRLSDALLTGIVLFIAIGAKATTLPFLGIPLAAALTLRRPGQSWRQAYRENGRWLVVALGSGLGLVSVFVIALRVLHHDLFAFITLYNSEVTTPILSHLVANIGSGLALFNGYSGPIVLVVLLIAVLLLTIRRELYLPLCLCAPVLVLWLNERFFSRYLVAPFAILFLAGAIVLARVIQQRSRGVQVLALGVVLVWGAIQWLPFTWAAYHAPLDMALATSDRKEYVVSDAGGFGLDEVHAVLRQQNAKHVIGILSDCIGLHYLALADLSVDCPQINPTGEQIPALTALMLKSQQPGVFVVLETLPYAPKSSPGKLIKVITRPDNGPTLAIYDLSPTQPLSP